MKFLIGEPDFLWSATVPTAVSYRMTRDLTNYPTYTKYSKKKRKPIRHGQEPFRVLISKTPSVLLHSKQKPFLSPGMVLLALLPFTDPYITNTTTLLQPCFEAKMWVLQHEPMCLPWQAPT